MTTEPLPDGTDLNDMMAGEWNAPEADDDDGIEMEDNHSLGVTAEKMAAFFPSKPLAP